jgi:ADP-heptose:LPS heptosyltransferase
MSVDPSKLNILVFKKGATGDMVAVSPSISALRHYYPNAKITLLSSKYIRNVYPQGSLSDYSIDLEDFSDTFWGYLKLLRKLRSLHFDIAICFSLYSFKYASLITFCGAKKTAGYGSTNFRYLFTNKPPFFKERRHEYTRHLDIVQSLGIELINPEPYIFYEPKHIEAAQAFYNSNGLKKENTLIMSPTASHPSKAWPQERFIKIGKRFVDTFKGKILITYAPAEKEYATQIAEAIGNSALLAPPTDVATLAALISLGGMSICNNSGAMNIAVAVKIPTLALSSTPSADWGAYGVGNITIYPFENNPDPTKHDWAQRASHEERMEIQKLITVDQVWEKLNARWEKLYS